MYSGTTPLANQIRSFAAQIIVTRTQDNYETKRIDFSNELTAEQEFDSHTQKGNEYEGYLQWDLTVKHPELGTLIRRTMFTQE